MTETKVDNTVDTPPTVYNYDSTTGAYLSESLADANPVNIESWIIPNNATLIAPPQEMEGNIRIFSNGAWGYVKWNRPQDGVSEEPHGPSIEDVVHERTLRLESGFPYDFGENDPRGVHHIGTSEDDMKGWDEVTKLANALIMSGQPDAQIDILTNTGAIKVTAMEWQHILIFAGTVRQPIFAASFALQAMWPQIPADYRDDSHWPQFDTSYIDEAEALAAATNAEWIPPAGWDGTYQIIPPPEETPTE